MTNVISHHAVTQEPFLREEEARGGVGVSTEVLRVESLLLF